MAFCCFSAWKQVTEFPKRLGFANAANQTPSQRNFRFVDHFFGKREKEGRLEDMVCLSHYSFDT